MICFSADDFGLCETVSARIQQCVDRGALNKVSVFPNLDDFDLEKIKKNKDVRLSLHLNLVEGKCLTDAIEIPLLAESNGNLKHTFGGLLLLSIFRKKEFEAQIYKEIKAQILFWKSRLTMDIPFCIDSHQHTSMIPSVFRVILQVLKEENITPKYMRIPAEPLQPYIMTPSLWFTYKPINLIKQWLLDILWVFNKGAAKKANIQTSYFLGILFSGKMDERRVCMILKKYLRLAEKDGRDIEVLFHPGYTDGSEPDWIEKNIVFDKFYVSANRKTEYDSVMTIAERRIMKDNALY